VAGSRQQLGDRTLLAAVAAVAALAGSRRGSEVLVGRLRTVRVGQADRDRVGRRDQVDRRDERNGAVCGGGRLVAPTVTARPDQADQLLGETGDVTAAGAVLLDQLDPQRVGGSPLPVLGGVRRAQAPQRLGVLAAFLVDAAQPTEALGEDRMEQVTFGRVDRVAEQAQRLAVPPRRQVHPGRQCEVEPAPRRCCRRTHRAADDRGRRARRCPGLTAVQQRQHQLQHQPRADRAAVVCRRGQLGQ
jgi:hypothetical protein